MPLGSRKYVSVSYDAETQSRLRDFCKQYGFDISHDFNGNEIDPKDFDFHTTVFYTTTRHRLANMVMPFRAIVTPYALEMFGENAEIPVLRVECENLRNIRRSFEDIYKMEDEWPDYKPHVSLSYKYVGSNDIQVLPDFPLVTESLKIKDVKGND